MTAQDIADRFLSGETTPARVRKLYALCVRCNVRIEDVIALLPDDVQGAVTL